MIRHNKIVYGIKFTGKMETVAGILRLLARASDGFYTTGPDLFLRRATHVRTG